MRTLREWFAGSGTTGSPRGVFAVSAGTGPRLLILSGEKRNQNYSRDLALVRAAGGDRGPTPHPSRD